jgi:hypothetical protein
VTRTIELSTFLAAEPDAVWRHVQTSALLHHVASPLIRFKPLEGAFPSRWQPGKYRANMLLFGVLPIGWQAVVIDHPEPEGDTRFIRDNGFGPLVRRWDHLIAIRPEGSGTRYVDRVTIDAGLLTPVVAAFARVFYAHRQRRWRQLASTNFAALA